MEDTRRSDKGKNAAASSALRFLPISRALLRLGIDKAPPGV